MKLVNDFKKINSQKLKGFTLLELLIAIGIVALLAALAAPAMAPFVARQQLRSITQDLADSIQLARSESLTNGNIYQVEANSQWNDGWSISIVNQGGANSIFKRYSAISPAINITGNSVSGGNNRVVFDQNARVNSRINFEVTHNELSLQPYCISVAASGNVSSTRGAC